MRGEGITAASVAASSRERSRADFPRYFRAAASTPKVCGPNSITFRYSSRMRFLERRDSRRQAIASSRSLRHGVRAGERYRFLASCCVIVDPPAFSFPLSQFFSAAPRSASQSTPSCSQKRASSATTAARIIAGEMRERGTGDQSSFAGLPAFASWALRLSMNAVVFGQEDARESTSGSVAQNTTTAAARSAAAAKKTRRFTKRGSLALGRGERPSQLPDALVRLVLGENEVRPEANRAGAGGQAHQAVLQAGGERAVAGSLVGKVERDEEPAPAHVRHDSRELIGELAEPGLQVISDDPRVLDQVVFRDDLEIARAADHVHEVSDPGR